ncbi:MAG: trehalose-6-phosphate synthase [Myxococcales bacterium]|nr:trehalose-6-phosphate synthase [Myxococcales bacterium]
MKLEPKLREGFYMGLSNAILWPLLHGFATTIAVADAPWDDYVKANERFAKATLESSRPRDLVWIQDYHLMIVPGLLRKARRRQRIGWFCHVPWPPPSTFGILPWREAILEGLLGADVLGFHTEEYVTAFLECAQTYGPYEVDLDARTVRVGARTVRVIAAPIGIATTALDALARSEEVEDELVRLRAKTGGRRILLGVDRLDYTKGIIERMRAFDRFLAKDKSARERVLFVQIMVPSRTDVQAYAELKDEIDRLVGDINGRYATTGIVPLQYFYRNFNQRRLLAHYRAADVAVVTPLRDGMNLVAHEYVASRIHENGVLVLSEFAGAAAFFDGHPLLVNPYDVDGIATALEKALAMPATEASARMRSLREIVRGLDVQRWADGFLEALES